MKALKLNIPDFVDIEEKELKIILAAKLFELGRLSMGQAAQLSELTLKEFIISIGKYNVCVFNYPIDEISKDVKNLS